MSNLFGPRIARLLKLTSLVGLKNPQRDTIYQDDNGGVSIGGTEVLGMLRDENGQLYIPNQITPALQAAVGLEYEDSNTVKVQIVPRTGTLASLLGLAGNTGEIASANDAPALVQFNGQANEAVTFLASGTRNTNIQGTGNVAMPAQKPNTGMIRITSDAGVNSITNFGQLQVGYVTGQEIRVLNATNQIQTFYHGNATYPTTIGVGYFVVARWDGAAWNPIRVEKLSAPNNGAVALGTTPSSGPRSVSIGQAADASGENAVAILGTATALNAVSAGGASAGGVASFACAGGFTYGKYSVSLGGSALWPAQVAGATASPSSATVYPQWSTALLATRTTSATPRTMTTSGNLPLAADNTLGGEWTGARYFLATIFAHVPGQQKCLVFKRSGVIYKDGTTATMISPVVTEGADINVGVGGAPAVAIAVGATYQDLSITVTGVASTTLIWSARIDFTETVA